MQQAIIRCCTTVDWDDVNDEVRLPTVDPSSWLNIVPDKRTVQSRGSVL